MKEDTKEDLVKLGVGAGAITGITFLGYEVIQALSGPPGGACNQKGTPCYECILPYQKELLLLTSQFNSYYASILEADAAANSGITAQQQSEIDNYQNQINQQIRGIQECAKQYTPDTWQTVTGGIVTAIIILAVGVAIGKIIQSLRSYKEPPQNRNGGGGGWISNMLLLANLQSLLNQNKITPENASALSSSAQSISNEQIASVGTFTQEMVASELISQAEAAAITAAMTAAMLSDTEAVLLILAAA